MGAAFTAITAIGAEFELTRSTIDGGGVMRSTGAEFDLSGTIGQPDAGEMRRGEFTLTGGFWIETPPGDCEEDGDVDLMDYDQFKECLNGPAGPAPLGPCRCFDVDRSGAVDLRDFHVTQSTYTGS